MTSFFMPSPKPVMVRRPPFETPPAAAPQDKGGGLESATDNVQRVDRLMSTDNQHDYFAFEQHDPPPPPEDGDEVARPEGDDDLSLFDPVLDALKTVRDPEIPVDLVNLGLIYELLVKKGGIVFVEMTLTTPSCPVAASMPDEVKQAISAVPGVEDVRVKLVWSPPWTQDRMSAEARLDLGLL
jgi:FeS assembly SUF system protein